MSGDVISLIADNNSNSFKFKEEIMSQTDKNGRKDDEIMVPLKYLCTFSRTLEMSLINCETNLILTWAANLFTSAATVTNQVPTFAITDTKLPGCNFINSK